MLSVRSLITLAAIAGAVAALPAGAQQDTTHPTTPHAVAKDAGRTAKSGAKSVGSTIHHGLKHAGRNLKSTAAKVVGDTVPEAPGHKPGGLNKVARDVSGAAKKAGRSAKSGVHTAGSKTHKALKSPGRAVKDSIH